MTSGAVMIVVLPHLAKIDHASNAAPREADLGAYQLQRVAHEVKSPDPVGLSLGGRLRPLIPSLRYRVGPSAVFGVVPKAGFFAIKRRANGPLSHVIKKGQKGAPGFAHRNSNRAVVLEGSVVGIGTPLNHRVPGLVGQRSAEPMNILARSARLGLEASAGFSEPGSKGAYCDESLAPALAKASPDVRPALALAGWFNCSKAREFLSSYVMHEPIIKDRETIVDNILFNGAK